MGHHLSVGAPSSFIDSLDRAFGNRLPITLSSEREAIMLDGMAAATENNEFREAYETLAQAIRDEVEIEIFAEY